MREEVSIKTLVNLLFHGKQKVQTFSKIWGTRRIYELQFHARFEHKHHI
jgi:hypothetical protein